MNNSLKKFDDLMSHLNSEDNDMAQEFREHLIEGIDKWREASIIISTLYEHGIDNWVGYDDAMQDAYEAYQR